MLNSSADAGLLCPSSYASLLGSFLCVSKEEQLIVFGSMCVAWALVTQLW